MSTKTTEKATQIAQQLEFDWSSAGQGAEDDLTQTAVTSAAAALSSFGLSIGTSPAVFQTVDQAALAWAKERAAELVGMRRLKDGTWGANPDAQWATTDGTRALLRGTIADALEQGWSAGQLRQEIRNSYAFSNARALNIARSEIIRAHGQSGLLAAHGAGMEMKEWLDSSDSCDDCVENAAAGLIPIDEDYPGGVDAPGQHPSCRCSQAFSRASAETEENAEAA